MRALIGIGANLGDRLATFEGAAKRLQIHSPVSLRISPVYETPALLPPGAPSSWRRPYLNAVVEMEWPGSAMELLRFLKQTERDFGREAAARWAPRSLDLDLLLFGEESLRLNENGLDLIVPHPAYLDRSFVLDPLKDLCAEFAPRARSLKSHAPLWMGIINLTPDSFSGDGMNRFEATDEVRAALEAELSACDEAHVQILDLGAESTRPRAELISEAVEWERLRQALEIVRSRFAERVFRPLVSLDTRRASIAKRALDEGYPVDIINDVSGGADPEMMSVLRSSRCSYVFMHNLGIPAGRGAMDARLDPVSEVKFWAQTKIDEFEGAGIERSRLIFDPGLGFGKTAEQSVEIISRMREFSPLLDGFDLARERGGSAALSAKTAPVRLLIGHSRKAFLKTLSPRAPASGEVSGAGLDPESIGLSIRAAEMGCDVLRVHRPHWHKRAFQSYRSVQ